MVTTRRRSHESTGDEDQEIPDLKGIIAAEVGEVLHELLLGLFDQMRRELTQVVNQQVETAMAGRGNGVGSSQSGQSRVVNYQDFSVCQLSIIEGKKDFVASTRWISEMEGAFHTSFCSAEVKMRFAVNLLRGPAKDWWNLIVQSRTEEQVERMTWEQFTELFREQYVP